MANRTVKDAISVKGTNPQYLVEKIIRSRIYDSKYWKEECFALTAELLVDKAMELRSIGGVFGGNIKPTPFLCLVLKMLQIQPEKDIVVEFIKNEDFKYVRALGAYYMRLTGTSVDCFKYLEPLLNDYRKIRFQNKQGQYELLHIDEFVDNLLREERYCDVILPRIQKRWVLEEANELLPRISALEEDLDAESSEEESDEEIAPPPPPMIVREEHRDRERRHHREERSHRPRDREHEQRERDRDREHRRERREDRDRSARSHHRREREHGERSHGDREHRHREHRHDRDRRDRHSDRRDRGDRDRDNRHGRRKDIADEIAEANALRAKLGMAPLRP